MDQELLDIFQVEKEKLCDLIEPGSICGRVTQEFAELTGCPHGIPVITAGGDQQCGAIGQGVVKKGILSATAGTGGFLDWFRKEFYTGCSYEEVNEALASSPVGANGCLCLPYFQGRSTPDWNNLAKVVFANVTLGTTKSDMLRSLLEGICYEIGRVPKE